MLDELLVHVRSLETLGVSGDQYGVILTPLILSRLPETVRDAWARESEGKEADLEWLLSFIQKERATRERAASFVAMAAAAVGSPSRGLLQVHQLQRSGSRVQHQHCTPAAPAVACVAIQVTRQISAESYSVWGFRTDTRR